MSALPKSTELRDPYASGRVVKLGEDLMQDLGVDADSGLGIVTVREPGSGFVGVSGLAVIGGEDGHVDGCTPLPLPDMGKATPFVNVREDDTQLSPLDKVHARTLRDSLSVHVADNPTDLRSAELCSVLSIAAT